MVIALKLKRLTWLLVLVAANYFWHAPAEAQIFAPQRQPQDIVSMYFFNGRDESTFKRELDLQASLRVERVAAIVTLTESQREKLDLAIRGDLCRFYRELEEVREETKGLNVQVQQEMQQAWQILSPLYQRFHNEGVIGADSLYEKVLTGLLDEQQQEQYQSYVAARNRFQMQALAEVTIAEVEKSMPMLADQRDQLIALLEQQPMPKSVNRGMESYVGYAILRKIEREQITQILDEQQSQVFDDVLKQFGRLGGVRW